MAKDTAVVTVETVPKLSNGTILRLVLSSSSVT